MALEKSDTSQKASSYTFQEGASYDGLQSAYKSTKDPRAFFCQPITIAFYASTMDNPGHAEHFQIKLGQIYTVHSSYQPGNKGQKMRS